VLDGVCAATFATVVPLTAADLTRGTGHFNLVIGLAGTALSVGASAGMAASGHIGHRYGANVAFLGLAAAAASAFVLTWCCMPETGRRPGPG
jgi:predicted MFS family arabinose efflux permease